MFAIIYVILSVCLVSSLFSFYYMRKKKQQEIVSLKKTVHDTLDTLNALHIQYCLVTEQVKELFNDPITQLPTYRVLIAELERAMEESKRYSFYLALCLVEVINNQALPDEDKDTRDIFLAECAQLMQPAIRKIDFLAHYDGNVFALLLTGLNQPERASLAVQRVFDVLTKAKLTAAAAWNKTVSIGIAIYPTDGDTVKEFVAHAMHALAIAKERKSNAYQFYDHSLYVQSQREHFLVHVMQGSHFFEQLELSYYPIVQLAQNKIIALRVVLTWRHPELGLVPETETLEWAEKQNRLIGMMVWQLERACKDFLEMRKRGSTIDTLIVTTPVALIKNTRFIYGLQQWLTRWRFPPECLCLQVYGDYLSIGVEEFEKTANMLRYLNISLGLLQQEQQALPFDYFLRIPFTYYKLNDTMLCNMLESSRVRAVLSAVSQFMKQLSIQLIVFDAVTSMQRDILRQLGVDLVEREKSVEFVYEH